jgi:N-acetylglucosaminyldiphosphoundecaprenol N-acetyl-beta-D-mannosaminyltransferase
LLPWNPVHNSPPVTLPVLRRTELFELDFVDAATEAEISEILQSPREIEHRSECSLPLIVTPNVDQLVHIAHGTSAEAAAIVRQAAYVLPDGQPVVWASRLLGTPLSARLAGSTLVSELWPMLLSEGRRVLVIANSSEINARVRAETGATNSSIVAPMFVAGDRVAITDFAVDCANLITIEQPEFVFVTLGFPKQCLLISDIVNNCRAAGTKLPLFLAIGASFDMYYGLVKRAPQWMQRSGLEWFYRFSQEPRRLFHRYFVQDPYFIVLTWSEWRKRRRNHPTI